MEPIRVSAKTLDDAITKACIELGVTSESIQYDIVETGSNGVFGIGARPYVISVSVKQAEEAMKEDMDTLPEEDKKALSPKEKAIDFLSSVFEGMGLDVAIDASISEDGHEMNVVLSGDDMGVLIGKRGQTLDAIQYLTGQVVNKHSNDYIRVKVDTENYRERRRETLEKLAKNIAYKVKRTKKPVALEPMNPYERRIIHSVLQPDKDILTRSEGEEPYRHVVICFAKKRKS